MLQGSVFAALLHMNERLYGFDLRQAAGMGGLTPVAGECFLGAYDLFLGVHVFICF